MPFKLLRPPVGQPQALVEVDSREVHPWVMVFVSSLV